MAKSLFENNGGEMNKMYPIEALTENGVSGKGLVEYSALIIHDDGKWSFITLRPEVEGFYHVRVDYRTKYINCTKRPVPFGWPLVRMITDLEISLDELQCAMWSSVMPDTASKTSVYFIEAANGYIKIGFTYSVQDRLNSLRSMSPIGLKVLTAVPGGFDDERALHVRFAKHRSHGEWFRPHEELISYIASIKANRALVHLRKTPPDVESALRELESADI